MERAVKQEPEVVQVPEGRKHTRWRRPSKSSDQNSYELTETEQNAQSLCSSAPGPLPTYYGFLISILWDFCMCEQMGLCFL